MAAVTLTIKAARGESCWAYEKQTLEWILSKVTALFNVQGPKRQ